MLKKTPFYDLHLQAGAKLTNFGGFDMPVQYESIRNEHQSVREQAGMFDVSHMGEFFIEGPEALELVQHLTINDASKLTPGKAQYSVMCYNHGGIVDDLLVYKIDDNEFMLVVNASNIRKDENWINQNNGFDARLQNRSDDMCLLAVQGPNSTQTLQKLTDADLSVIPFYSFKKAPLAEFDDVIISATGYTGEQGFELYFNKQEVDAEEIWNAIIEAGKEFDLTLCGLGARDTLRLEMGYLLYGNDISEDTNPLAAGLGWLTKLEKGEFIGRQSLQNAHEEGTEHKLVGFVVDDKRSIPRTGYEILSKSGEELGFVTSGSRSITLDKNIGMGYVKTDDSEQGTSIQVKIRNKIAEAIVKKPPFLKKD